MGKFEINQQYCALKCAVINISSTINVIMESQSLRMHRHRQIWSDARNSRNRSLFGSWRKWKLETPWVQANRQGRVLCFVKVERESPPLAWLESAKGVNCLRPLVLVGFLCSTARDHSSAKFRITKRTHPRIISRYG